MREWVKHQDPNNKYGAKFTLGDRNVELPETAIISVTRGENFNIIRIMINGITETVKKYGRHFDGGRLIHPAQQPPKK